MKQNELIELNSSMELEFRRQPMLTKLLVKPSRPSSPPTCSIQKKSQLTE